MDILFIVIFSIIGYLIGSLNFAYIIAKYIYKKDLRQHGSGNLGGTNAGRVLGKPAGIAVILLDVFKAFFVVMLFHKINLTASLFAGAAATIGHCFPVFLNFKGGKGVATYVGFLIAIGVFTEIDFTLLFLLPLCVFLFCLSLTRYVSLSSMILSVTACLVSFLISPIKQLPYILLAMSLLIIFKHAANIIRILRKQESKIKWLF